MVKLAITSLLTLASLALVAVSPVRTLAEDGGDVPSYATHDETIHGRITQFDGQFNLQLRDDRGFVDSVRLHQGTIINPTGLQLATGLSVTILGHPDGNVFDANEIDTPYEQDPGPGYAYGGVGYADPYPYYGYGCCYGYGYGFGYPFAFGLAFGFGGGYYGGYYGGGYGHGGYGYNHGGYGHGPGGFNYGHGTGGGYQRVGSYDTGRRYPTGYGRSGGTYAGRSYGGGGSVRSYGGGGAIRSYSGGFAGGGHGGGGGRR